MGQQLCNVVDFSIKKSLLLSFSGRIKSCFGLETHFQFPLLTWAFYPAVLVSQGQESSTVHTKKVLPLHGFCPHHQAAQIEKVPLTQSKQRPKIYPPDLCQLPIRLGPSNCICSFLQILQGCAVLSCLHSLLEDLNRDVAFPFIILALINCGSQVKGKGVSSQSRNVIISRKCKLSSVLTVGDVLELFSIKWIKLCSYFMGFLFIQIELHTV